MPGLVLQVARQPAGDRPGALRYGLTASRRVGNAVVRNRVRRRLRAVAEEVLPRLARDGHDYVLIGRRASARRRHDELRRDLEAGLRRLGAAREGADDAPPQG